MKKYGYVVLAAIAVALISLGMSSSAHADTAARVQPTSHVAHSKLDDTVLPTANGAPAPTDQKADLPGTRGPGWVVLLGGLVLAFSGATAVTVARRGAEEVELPGQTA